MTYYGMKNFYIDGIKVHFYALTVNAISYGQMLLAFLVQENTFYLDILLYKRSARIYLSATKSILQVE